MGGVTGQHLGHAITAASKPGPDFVWMKKIGQNVRILLRQ